MSSLSATPSSFRWNPVICQVDSSGWPTFTFIVEYTNVVVASPGVDRITAVSLAASIDSLEVSRRLEYESHATAMRATTIATACSTGNAGRFIANPSDAIQYVRRSERNLVRGRLTLGADP